MKKVLLLLAEGFETYEASVFIDVFGWNLIEGGQNTQLESCGPTSIIKSSFNQNYLVDFTLDEIDVSEYDALAVPGGFEEYGFYKSAYQEDFLNLIREFHRQGKIIASICTAALPLAKSGILNGAKGTTYNGKDRIRQKQLKELGVHIVQEPLVFDHNVVTSWNPSTAMNVALFLLEKLTDSQTAQDIRQLMGFHS